MLFWIPIVKSPTCLCLRCMPIPVSRISYYFSCATVINCHIVSSFKQPKFIISQSVGQKSEHRVAWLFPLFQLSQGWNRGVSMSAFPSEGCRWGERVAGTMKNLLSGDWFCWQNSVPCSCGTEVPISFSSCQLGAALICYRPPSCPCIPWIFLMLPHLYFLFFCYIFLNDLLPCSFNVRAQAIKLGSSG